MHKGPDIQVERFKPFYTVGECAELLAVTRATIYTWIRDRVIPWTVKTPGGTRVTGKALEAFIKERAV